jgi:hypothetical protein
MGGSGSVEGKGDGNGDLEWLGLCVEKKHLQAKSEQGAWCCNPSCFKDVKRNDSSRELGALGSKLDRERRKAASLALHRAAENGILHEVEPIVKLWANTPEIINSVDTEGNTALHKAAGRDHLEICKILCKVHTRLYFLLKIGFKMADKHYLSTEHQLQCATRLRGLLSWQHVINALLGVCTFSKHTHPPQNSTRQPW